MTARAPIAFGEYKTWLATRVGRETMVRVDFAGPVNVPEIDRLIAYLQMVRGWWAEDEQSLGEALVKWAEAIAESQCMSSPEKP